MPAYRSQEAHREYTRCLDWAQQLIAKENRRHIRIGNIRLVIFIAALIIAWLAFIRHSVHPLWLAAPLALFIALAFADDAVLRKRSLRERQARYYVRGLSRIEETWAGSGATGDRFADPHHLYAQDLDIFGVGSLFELLSVARTSLGEKMLAQWLLAPATIAEIRTRHAAINELRDLPEFRETLAIIGNEAVSETAEVPLWTWGEVTPIRVSPFLRIAAAGLSAVMAFALLWFAFGEFEWLGGAAPRPPLLALRFLIVVSVIAGAFGFYWRKRVNRSIEEFETIRAGLALLSDLLVAIERCSFTSPELRRLQESIAGGVPPSRHIARLNRHSDLIDSRENFFVRLFGHPLLWTTQVAFAIEHWRMKYGYLTRAWVETVSEIEALCSLATYAYERPDNPFPELVAGDTCFEGEDLGHPLLPGCVRNSVSLRNDRALLIVSGSNMSGKSTLLRTVGINAVLALCGAPVRARSLRISELRPATSLRVSDSLKEGASHFAAEISRVRQIVDTAERYAPALFLIDEILQGTNSHDRLIGTEAILRKLLQLGAIGLITTHDLALTELARAIGERAVNVHFEDHIQDGRMAFDYKLKPGVVKGSNAVELMRLYGLI